jgi:deoxyribodipyrimidine photo-lyase
VEKQKVRIFWFRRDLRWQDNYGLFQAIKDLPPDVSFLPLFIFDSEILSKLDSDDKRIPFLCLTVNQMQDEIYNECRAHLNVVVGRPLEIFTELLKIYQIESVYCNHDYEPYAVERDHKIETLLQLQGSSFKSFKDQVIFERNEISKDDGKPYLVFTAYKNRWLKELDQSKIQEWDTGSLLKKNGRWSLLSAPMNIATTLRQNSAQGDVASTHKTEKPKGLDIAADKIGEFHFKPMASSFFPGKDLNVKLLKSYAGSRDTPSIEGTSRLGVHLRFGTISIRHCVGIAQQHSDAWLSELIWREFFMQNLYRFPHTQNSNWNSKFDHVQWRESPSDFAAWCEGRTGYPLVDAGMRQLAATGFMHNRVRMVAGSFLCKHLLTYWHAGERYFAKTLLDYDLSANVGNWQWVAGTGCDASPYFRVFNPEAQRAKFDAKSIYVREWVPEFETSAYVKPIIEHTFARQRALDAYRRTN